MSTLSILSLTGLCYVLALYEMSYKYMGICLVKGQVLSKTTVHSLHKARSISMKSHDPLLFSERVSKMNLYLFRIKTSLLKFVYKFYYVANIILELNFSFICFHLFLNSALQSTGHDFFCRDWMTNLYHISSRILLHFWVILCLFYLFVCAAWMSLISW